MFRDNGARTYQLSVQYSEQVRPVESLVRCGATEFEAGTGKRFVLPDRMHEGIMPYGACVFVKRALH